MYNPPSTRDEIRDTIGFLGLNCVYEKMMSKGNHVFTLEFEKDFICIYSPTYMTMNKIKFRTAKDLKLELMRKYL